MRQATAEISATNFRQFLQVEFSRRNQNNDSYSLRAFARSLGIEPSFLTKLLRGQRRLTPRTIKRLGERLKLSPNEIDKFSKDAASNLKKIDEFPFKQVVADTFESISNWYSLAILELIALKNFRPDTKWISQKLRMHPQEVDATVERLERLKLLEKNENGWKDTFENLTTLGHAHVTEAHKKLQRQVLEKAIDALDLTPVSRREQRTLTFAIDSTRIDEARELITEFRKAMSKLFKDKSKANDVYNFTISFYPVTQSEPEETAL